MRRDLLDTYAKLLDHVAINMPKLGEPDFWQRPGKGDAGQSEVGRFGLEN
jgi:hypothetical protein